MANDDFDVNEIEETSEGFKSLRKAYNALKKDADSLRDRVTSHEKEAAQSRILNIVKAKGLPDKAAALYAGDDSEESITKWADEYADVFGVKPVTTEAPSGETHQEAESDAETPPADNPVDDAIREQQRRLSVLSSPVDATVGGPVMSALHAADSPDAVIAALKGLHT